MFTSLVIMMFRHTFCLDWNILQSDSVIHTECLCHFCLQFFKWLEAEETCFRSTAYSCSYSARIIYHVLNRWLSVALVLTALVIAALQDSSISKNLWPPRSPDLTQPNFFLWGYTKERVQRNKLHTTAALKDIIRLKSTNNEKSVLQWTANNM